MNTPIKHNKSKRHRSKLSTNSVVAQMDAMDWNFQREDDDDEDDEDEDGGDWDTNADGCSPKDDRDCDAQGDPSLAKNVGLNNSASTFLNSKPLHSATICLIDWQHFEK